MLNFNEKEMLASFTSLQEKADNNLNISSRIFSNAKYKYTLLLRRRDKRARLFKTCFDRGQLSGAWWSRRSMNERLTASYGKILQEVIG